MHASKSNIDPQNLITKRGKNKFTKYKCSRSDNLKMKWKFKFFCDIAKVYYFLQFLKKSLHLLTNYSKLTLQSTQILT